jgi:hypothetical protein
MCADFSARDPILGYLFQARYALWLLLNGLEEQELILEGLDDIEFEINGTAQELLQIKHHSTVASLTDTSVELWKTIRIWSTHVASGKINPRSTILTLITTAVASDNTIAARLRPDSNRDSNKALTDLCHIADISRNEKLKSAFTAFLDLTSDKRRVLVDSIRILDNSFNIDDAADKIKDRLKFAVNRKHLDGLYERLEGWWFGKVVTHLRSGLQNPIAGFEVHDRIRFIADQFRPDALPIDFLDAEPKQVDPVNDSRLFVHQLKAIMVQNKRIEKAIIDYYRAFEQRSRWAREELLIGDELEQYEKKLIDEWERFSLAISDEYAGNEHSEIELQKIGRHIYNWAEQDADFRIRPEVTEPYVMRGSYQMLANEYPPRIWWHPRFITRLEELLVQRMVLE